MILERSKESSFTEYFYITLDGVTYDADAFIAYPLDENEYSPAKEAVILFFAFCPQTGRKFLFGKYFECLTKDDYDEKNLNGGKPTGGLVFYKDIEFLDKFNKHYKS